MPSLFIVLSEIVPLSIMIIGIALNIMVVLVFTSKSLIKSFQPAISMTVLALNDIMALFSLVMNTNTYWRPQLGILNDTSCKIFSFMMFFFQAMSCWITAFISIERILSIWCQNTTIYKSLVFKAIAMTCMHAWNFLFYSTNFMFDELSQSNISMTIVCGPTNAIPYDLAIYGNLANSIIIKNLYMVRKSVGVSHDAQKRLRDIKFSVSIVFLDVMFFAFHTPLLVIRYSSHTSYVIPYVMINIYLLQYGVNLFIYLSFYEKFREQFFYMFFNFRA